MDSRSRNRRVSIQQLGTARDDIGQPVKTWTEVVSVMANIRYLRGTEAIKADKDTSVSQASLRIRYRTNVTNGMRVVHGATVFQVNSVLPDEAGQQYVDLACEVVNG